MSAGAAHAIHEALIGEFPSRALIASPISRPAVANSANLAHPSASKVRDLTDEAQLLGDPMNSSGGIAPCGILPTGQRFDLLNLTRQDVGDRLVHHAELTLVLKSVGQQTAEHEPPLHALVVFNRVQLNRAPALLGEVHGNVRPLEE